MNLEKLLIFQENMLTEVETKRHWFNEKILQFFFGWHDLGKQEDKVLIKAELKRYQLK